MRFHIVAFAVLAAMACSSSQLWGQVPQIYRYEEKTPADGISDYLPDVADILGAVLDDSPHTQHYDHVTKGGRTEPLAFMTFKKNERFVFVVPVTLMPSTAGCPNWRWLDMGCKVFWFDHDLLAQTPRVPMLIPNKILRIRQSLLDAQAYFDAVFKQAGITPNFYMPNEPILVFIGHFPSGETKWAYTSAWFNRIKIDHILPPEQLETTPIHEYFHCVQKAVAKNPVKLSTVTHADAGERTLWKKFNEWTCQWASDEPIQVNHIVGGVVNADDKNAYLRDRNEQYGVYFSDHLMPLFSRDPYLNGIVIKYFAEQAAGGSDKSAARQVLRLHQKFVVPGPAEDILKTIAEALPQGRFTGGKWQERWQHFFRAFSASSVVQRASSAHQPAGLLGYHDDAFASLKEMYDVSLDKTFDKDYSAMPDRIYPKSAANPEQRNDRLARLARAGSPVKVQPLSNGLFLVNLSDGIDHDGVHKGVQPRTAFFYAWGDDGTDVFLLHQATLGKNHSDRQKSAFRLNEDFTLAGKRPSLPGGWGHIPATATESYITVDDKRSDYLWVGLVNSYPDEQERELSWSYVVVPQLLPVLDNEELMTVPQPRGTTKVRLIRGDPLTRDEAEGFYNGDKFTIAVRTLGPAHLGDTSKRSIDLQVISQKTGQPIKLVESDGQTLKVSCAEDSKNNTYCYEFSGQIDPDNTTFGQCRFRVELTSLLNLGGLDKCTDDSYSFKLGTPGPRVERVQARSRREMLAESTGKKEVPGQIEASPETITDTLRSPGYDAQLQITVTPTIRLLDQELNVRVAIVKSLSGNFGGLVGRMNEVTVRMEAERPVVAVILEGPRGYRKNVGTSFEITLPVDGSDLPEDRFKLTVKTKFFEATKDFVFDFPARPAPKPPDETVVKVRFSEKMAETGTRITAGTSPPFDEYVVNDLTWDADRRTCSGTLKIEPEDIRSADPKMRLSITGVNEAGVRLDTDLIKPGDQPDTSHILTLDSAKGEDPTGPPEPAGSSSPPKATGGSGQPPENDPSSEDKEGKSELVPRPKEDPLSELLQNADSSFERGQYTTSEYQNALALYRQALDLDHGNVRAREKLDAIAAAHRELGERALREGRYERAAEYYETVRAIQPGDAEAVQQLAEIERQQESRTAEKFYRRVMEAAEETLESLQASRWKEAVTRSTVTLDLAGRMAEDYPDHPDAQVVLYLAHSLRHMALAVNLVSEGKRVEAKDEAEKAIESCRQADALASRERLRQMAKENLRRSEAICKLAEKED